MEIRHIPGKQNPADALSRQLVSDALVRKESIKDANAEYVMRLRVAENATDDKIQNALYQIFNSSPQGNQSIQCHQRQTILAMIPQGESVSMNYDKSRPSIMSATAISKIQLDATLKNSLHSFLQSEVPCSEILTELSAGTRQIFRSKFNL